MYSLAHFFLFSIFTAFKGTFIFHLLSLQLVVSCVAALKDGPVHRLDSVVYILLSVL